MRLLGSTYTNGRTLIIKRTIVDEVNIVDEVYEKEVITK
jgi:hypothetical protein